MKNKEFVELTQPLNAQYHKIFGVVPSKQGFICSREEYINALKEAIENEMPIEELLEKAGQPLNKESLTN